MSADRSEYQHDYYRRNKEKRQEYFKKYYEENKNKIKVVNDYNLIGSVITLSLLQGDTIVSTLEVGVVSL